MAVRQWLASPPVQERKKAESKRRKAEAKAKAEAEAQAKRDADAKGKDGKGGKKGGGKEKPPDDDPHGEGLASVEAPLAKARAWGADPLLPHAPVVDPWVHAWTRRRATCGRCCSTLRRSCACRCSPVSWPCERLVLVQKSVN